MRTFRISAMVNKIPFFQFDNPAVFQEIPAASAAAAVQVVGGPREAVRDERDGAERGGVEGADPAAGGKVLRPAAQGHPQEVQAAARSRLSQDRRRQEAQRD